ncbi:MAG: hypothetical protein ABIH11_06650 [Candidatus Altiarchaeota archaeon]
MPSRFLLVLLVLVVLQSGCIMPGEVKLKCSDGTRVSHIDECPSESTLSPEPTLPLNLSEMNLPTLPDMEKVIEELLAPDVDVTTTTSTTTTLYATTTLPDEAADDSIPGLTTLSIAPSTTLSTWEQDTATSTTLYSNDSVTGTTDTTSTTNKIIPTTTASMPPTRASTHLECRQGSCVTVLGYGSDKCSLDSECPYERPSCRDTDGGRNYFIAGMVFDKANRSYVDGCTSNRILREVYCGVDGYALTTDYECEGGCYLNSCAY